jgi:hypothetical protein
MSRDLTTYRGGLLHRSEWLRLGLHPRELATDRFTTVFPGYLTPTDHPASFNAMGWVLQTRVRPGSVLSHTTAALLWGIPVPWRLEDGVGLLRRPALGRGHGVPLIPAVLPDRVLGDDASLPVQHCRVEPGASSRIGRGAVVHRRRPGATARLGRFIVSSQAETVRELSTMLPLWDVIAAVETVIGAESEHPGETIDSLRDSTEAGRGTGGSLRMRRALDRARPGARSPSESVMRLILEAAGFPAAIPNLPVTHPRTGKVRYIDLAWKAVDLGLEYDGDGHRATKEQWREDEQRRDELASLGWTLARVNGDDLRQPLRILLRLQRSLGERGMHVPSEQHIHRTVARMAAEQPSLRLDEKRT